jgi:HK97 family phage prohead protease
LLFRFAVVLLFEDGMGKIQKTYTLARKGDWVIASTPAPDRDKDRVMPKGINVENFKGNPALFFGHNYADPAMLIGSVAEFSIDDAGMKFRPELREPASDSDPMTIIKSLWDSGLLRAASIGFIPRKSKANDLGGLDFDEVELLEISLVGLPANQQALRLAMKGFGMKAEGDEPQDEPEAPAASKGPDCRQADESEDECVARKLAEILEEAPDTPEDEAAARAAEMCAQSCEDEEQPQDEPAPADEPAPDPEQEGKRAAPVSKRGRVLSASNESKLRTAYESIGEVLSAVGDAPEQNAVAPAPVKAAKAAPVSEPALDEETISLLAVAVKDIEAMFKK